MPPPTNEQIAELKALMEKATPWPWEMREDPNDRSIEKLMAPLDPVEDLDEAEWEPVLEHSAFSHKETDANWDLIGPLRNLAPALIRAAEERNDAIGAREQLIGDLHAALEDYADAKQERDRLAAENAELLKDKERLKRQLLRNRTGLLNILELRHIAGTDRYGNLTGDEIRETIAEIDAALSSRQTERGEGAEG